VEVHPGDAFRWRCVYDNSAENQPVVDGVTVEPGLLSWGDGTEAEMCLAGAVFQVPFEEYIEGKPQAFGDIVVGESVAACTDLDGCMADCETPNSYTCVANCATQSLACLQCALESLDEACGSDCYDEVPLEPCVIECVSVITSGEMGLGDCLEDVCPEVAANLDECFGPYLSGGLCGALFSLCSL
jgi:hypothetical protein